jgi:hypothetical protein
MYMRCLMALVPALVPGIASFAAQPAIAPVEIPLDTIWGLDMPGTQDIRSLDSSDDPIVDQVLMQISETRRFGKKGVRTIYCSFPRAIKK